MSGRIPKLCRHKSTNRAYVTDPYHKKEVFLGQWGTVDAQSNYDTWVRKFLARRAEVSSGSPAGSSILVGTLILDYMGFAIGYYRKDGKVTSEIDSLKAALKPVCDLFGRVPADSFGPGELKQVRQKMIDLKWARGTVNRHIQRVRRMFRWGVEQQLVRPETLASLQSVPDLRKGRSAAKETTPIASVPLAILEATLARLDSTVRAIVEIQLYADMRPGETVIMRPCDIDRSGETWLYVPHTHKTEHHDQDRRIYLGPKARALLAPLILRCPDERAWLFPSRASGRYGSRATHWTVSGIRKAIREACKQEPALPRWHPNQLRHTQATLIRQQFGAEAAQAILGHANLSTTEIYAEKSDALARATAEKIG